MKSEFLAAALLLIVAVAIRPRSELDRLTGRFTAGPAPRRSNPRSDIRTLRLPGRFRRTIFRRLAHWQRIEVVDVADFLACVDVDSHGFHRITAEGQDGHSLPSQFSLLLNLSQAFRQAFKLRTDLHFHRVL